LNFFLGLAIRALLGPRIHPTSSIIVQKNTTNPLNERNEKWRRKQKPKLLKPNKHKNFLTIIMKRVPWELLLFSSK
jgi:hypothetical protein